MKLTHEEAHAVVGLMANHDFKLFLGAIARHAEELNQQLVFNDTKELGVMQGQTRTIVEIIQAIEKAPDTLAKYENQT